MSIPEFISSAYSQIFRLMSNIKIPYFNISFIDILIGTFVVTLSIGIFKSFIPISKVGYSSADSKKYSKKGGF